MIRFSPMYWAEENIADTATGSNPCIKNEYCEKNMVGIFMNSGLHIMNYSFIYLFIYFYNKQQILLFYIKIKIYIYIEK